MPSQHSPFLEYAPFLAMLIAIGVALMQYYLQRQQQKQNLFDKRLRVFSAIHEFWLVSIIYWQTVDDTTLHELISGIRPSLFLFGADVNQYVKEIDDIARQLEANLRTLSRLNKTDVTPGYGSAEWLDARNAANTKTVPLRYKLHELVGQSEERFSPYLQLHYDRSWFRRFIARINRWVNQEQPNTLASRYDT